MRQILIRLAGVALIGLGWGAALLVRAESRGGDPSAIEFVLVLATFALTVTGAVLAFNGNRPWGAPRKRPVDRSAAVAESNDADASLDYSGTERDILGRLLARRTLGGGK